MNPIPPNCQAAPARLPDACALFAELPDAVYLIDPMSSNILWGNRLAWEMLGLSADDVINHSVLSLQLDVTGLPQWSDIATVIRQNECFTFVGRHRHADGHEVAVEVNTSHFVSEGREYFLSVARDITRRVALEAELKTRENQLWFALNEATDGLWDWEIDSGNLFFSPQLKRMLGYGPDEMPPVLATWSDNVHPDDKARVLAILQSHLAGKRQRYEAEYRLRNRNGHYLWVHDRGRVCERDAQGKPSRVVGMVQDITNRKQLELKLEELASSDTLTGLPNRRQGTRFIESKLEFCRRLGLPMAIAFFDVDHFKQLNDRHGHSTGDAVLQRLANTVVSSLRRSDMVCRWGGEEFVLAAPNTTAEQMLEISEKVRKAVASMHAAPDGRSATLPAITASLGVAAFPRHGSDLGSLLEAADSALYQAKKSGRDRVVLAEATRDNT